VLATGTASSTGGGQKTIEIVVYVDGSPTAWKQQISLPSNGGSVTWQLLGAVSLTSGGRQVGVKANLVSGGGSVDVSAAAMTVTSLQ
jgi:hypothetical protein